MTKAKKSIAYLIVATLFLSLFTSLSSAQNMRVSLSFISDEGPVSECEISLYKVADKNGNLVGKFAAYPINFNLTDSESLSLTAKTLTNYIKADSTEPLKSEKTDSDGLVNFTLDEKGFYLLIGEKTAVGDNFYIPESVMFAMPNVNENGEEVYELNISAKYDKEPLNNETSIKVLKSWKNDDEKLRPESITVELISGGKVYDSVVLNKENSWRYEWKNLDSSKEWFLVEKDVPEGYNVSVSLQGTTFHVVNTSNNDKPKNEPTTGDKQEIIPETGALWWPIPYITCLGLLLIIIGYVKKNKDN